MQIKLRVLAGPHQGREFTFRQHDTFLIGRSEKAHLYLPDDKFFSRNHCILEIAPPRCFLRDLGSTNGTYVNGKKVQQAYLNNGDRIQGGQTVLAVEVSVPEEAPQPAAGLSANALELAPTRPSIVMIDCVNCGRREEAQAASPDEKLTFLCEDCREEMRRQPPPAPGYESIRVLGQGGMGCVMMARSLRTGQLVAIKTLLPEVAVSDQAIKRFMREIDVAAALQHPHVVRFIDRGTHKGTIYLVTEFVEGTDASRLAESSGGRLPFRETVQIVSQVLEALSYAHSKGYIHRDIKGQNILIGGSWPNYQAKLTDFGLAKSFTQTGMSGITMAGDMAGTFAYMPPEQLRDFKNVRPTADIYALGMTAYLLLTGSIALDVRPGANAAETVKAIFDKPIVPISRYAPEIPAQVAGIIESALAKDPSQRWQSADAMRNALLHSI